MQTVEQTILAIAQTFPFAQSATLNEDHSRIVGCLHAFKSEREAYSLAFSIPATIEAVLDTAEGFGL